jgi:hypothetical protein
MIPAASIPVQVTAEAGARVARLRLEVEMSRMIDYARQQLPEATRIEVVLYDRDEPGEPPGVAIEVYTPCDSFDSTARTRGRIGEWLVSQSPPRSWNSS